jgi:hypothetical protein
LAFSYVEVWTKSFFLMIFIAYFVWSLYFLAGPSLNETRPTLPNPPFPSQQCTWKSSTHILSTGSGAGGAGGLRSVFSSRGCFREMAFELSYAVFTSVGFWGAGLGLLFEVCPWGSSLLHIFSQTLPILFLLKF